MSGAQYDEKTQLPRGFDPVRVGGDARRLARIANVTHLTAP
jgi:hypothetical protein